MTTLSGLAMILTAQNVVSNSNKINYIDQVVTLDSFFK